MLWHFGYKLLKLILEEFALQKKLPKNARKGRENPKNVGDFLKNVGVFFKNVGDFFSPSPCILSKDVEMMRKGLIFSINSPRLNG